jgi:hypothetical protein
MASTAGKHTDHFRAHARLPTRLRALVTHLSGGWKRPLPVENLGLGGARILVDTKVAPGDSVILSLAAPTLWDSLLLQARVAWVGHGEPPYAAGVAFEHSSAHAVFALYELISTSCE